ncbi:sensor histidine kinase [Halalkalibacter kiskunsagensis]|uniref:Sensor histidine kinase n=1 Tax=Halalkalibacter kiskunsagensis TaxID=1548599 RepID=A0ABV6KDL6_9BACI
MKFFHSLFFKLLMCLLLISIVPLSVVGGITYYKASNNMTDNINFHANSILNQKVTALENLYNDLNRLSKGIVHNNLFSTFSENTNHRTHQQLYIELDKLLISIENIFPNFEGITLINEHGFIYHYGYSYNQQVTAANIYKTNWFQAIGDISQPQISALHTREYSNYDPDVPVYSFINKAWDDKLRSHSLIIIDFKEELLTNLLTDQENSELTAGTVIYGEKDYILPPHSELNLPFNIVKEHNSNSIITNDDGIDFLIYKQPFPLTNWNIVEYFEVDHLYKTVVDTKNISLYTIVISIFVCIFASLFVSHQISKPIHKLQRKMKEVEQGNFEESFITNSKDAIGDLANGFNHMLTKIKALIESVAKEEQLKKEAEITALQLQINPHFIYNTLESINSLARKKKEYEISHLIVLLGRLLRLSISTFEEKVPLRQEVMYIEYYLEIQKQRMRDTLTYEIFVEQNLKELSIIKWILQPIVENAIIHGIDPLRSEGKITINVTANHETLTFVITDNGVGIEQTKLAFIQAQLKDGSAQLTKYRNQVGLYNVQTRIQSHFGNDFGISIDSVINKGTSVKITLPLREETK